MRVNFSYKNLTESEKRFAREYFSSTAKLGKIRDLIDRLNPDATLEVRVEKFVKKSAYKVALLLQRPWNIFTSEDDHTLREAVDFAKDKMLERLRKEFVKRKRKRGNRA